MGPPLMGPSFGIQLLLALLSFGREPTLENYWAAAKELCLNYHR